jgi:SAM-dependent methyltransferase
MGLPRAVARLLMEEGKRRPFTGAVLELGRSFVYLTREETERWAARHGFALAPVAWRPSHVPDLAAQGCVDDRSFFGALGFSEVRSCDISDWEGADDLVDLNLPVPAELHGRFDLVFDVGTLTHVFDQRTAWRNVFDLVRPGGRVIHGVAPSSNHVDIGFFMFSPTLFADFYAANGWRIETLYFCEFDAWWVRGRMMSAPWRVYRYTPGCLDALRAGGLRRSQYAVFVVATKVDGATGDRIPMQGWYREFFASHGTRLAGESAAQGTRADAGTATAPASTARPPSPVLALWKRLRAGILRRLPPRMPPLVGRY